MAASFVRPGARFADIGTDHAYLPLALLDEGRIASAVAADIAEGPLGRARENVRAAGREAEVTLLLTPGLTGMEGLGLTDIAICGMGGEMILSILAAAPFVKDNGVRLILQPMTHVADVRRALATDGFSVTGERCALAAGRPYVCLAVTYTGEHRTLTPAEAELGDHAVWDPRDTEAYLTLLAARERETLARIAGKTQGGADTAAEVALLAAIKAERERLV